MRLAWKDAPLSDPAIAEHLAVALANGRKIHIDQSSVFRGGRSHLTLRRDASGRYFVRYGRRGSGKRYVEAAKLTFLDGKLLLTVFTLD